MTANFCELYTQNLESKKDKDILQCETNTICKSMSRIGLISELEKGKAKPMTAVESFQESPSSGYSSAGSSLHVKFSSNKVGKQIKGIKGF